MELREPAGDADLALGATRVVLLRHGQTAWNVEGRYQGHLESDLTAAGLAQAAALARRAAGQGLEAVYASDLRRAQQTAARIAAAVGLPVQVDPGLRERHLGIFQGLLKAETQARFPEEYARFKGGGPDHAVPGGESARDCQRRVLAALERIVRRHAGGRIVVVSHGGVLGAVFRHTLGIPLEAPRRFEPGNGSWNVFRHEAGRWHLETWGDVTHLAGGAGGGEPAEAG
ncbi:MAG: hypothetical protein RJA22_2819 [Verrucomicrobiota bacterium]